MTPQRIPRLDERLSD